MITPALLVSAPDTVSLGSVEVPDPGEGEVLIEVACSCVSPGTELRALAGRQPGSEKPRSFPATPLRGR